MTLDVIILAAGNGARMKSSLPKPLHTIGGKPLLEHVMNTAQFLSPENIYIVCNSHSKHGNQLRKYFENKALNFSHVVWTEQKEPLGTAHAVRQVIEYIKNNFISKQADKNKKMLILYGDMPLISCNTLKNLIQQTDLNQLGLLTANLENPYGYGRILRGKNNKIIKIIEEKDADLTQKAIQEVNAGVYLSSFDHLAQWLPKIKSDNAQCEYYLTDIADSRINQNTEITSIKVDNAIEIQGVNDRQQLNLLERYYQRQQSKQLMQNGVTVMDPERLDIRGEVYIEQDVFLDINIILEGNVTIAAGSKIGANCLLKNVSVGKNVEINSHCVIENAVISDGCKIGPFARIRPDTILLEKVSVGNFVEIKKSRIGAGSKISHLSYVGDTAMGENVNVGAGAITCNYDGVNKHQTVIGNDVFIGSDVQLIAPVHIEDGAFIGAGSTITKNAPKDKLTLSRSRQQIIPHWKKPKKNNS